MDVNLSVQVTETLGQVSSKRKCRGDGWQDPPPERKSWGGKIHTIEPSRPLIRSQFDPSSFCPRFYCQQTGREIRFFSVSAPLRIVPDMPSLWSGAMD
jgi:hypothetical protein